VRGYCRRKGLHFGDLVGSLEVPEPAASAASEY
jgi:hypothetical protein